MVRGVRGATSPVDGRRLQLVMTTGDNSDNTQANETRWMIDVLDGGRTVNPDSGRQGDACDQNPNGRYDGVRGDGHFYEPDSSAAGEDGPGYSPDQAENEATSGRRSQVRDFPGLLERANEPFRSTGLGVPWYGIFGNHDALIQGNQPRNAGFAAIATGCVKVTEPSAGTDTLAEAVQDLSAAAAGSPAFTGTATTVPPDPARRPQRKQEFMAQHFVTGGTPVGHGFTPQNVASGFGNYVVKPRPGLRFVVLDSINEGGGDGGNVDDPQFRWLHQQLLAAESAQELVMVFAHHSLQTMDQEPVSNFPPGDTGAPLIPAVHFGDGPRGTPLPVPCTATDPAAEPTPTETVRCLMLRHRGVVAFVNGHEHNNRIRAVTRDGGAPGGFWELNTAAHIDWPQQSRLLELFDNRDGTLSIFGTIVDHGSAPDPGAGAATASPERLASISRELSYNEPQSRNGEDSADARGTPQDRNVELLVRNPYSG